MEYSLKCKTWMYRGITVRYNKSNDGNRYYPNYNIYDVFGEFYNSLTPKLPDKNFVKKYIDSLIAEEMDIKRRFGSVYGEKFQWRFLQQ